MDTQLSLHDGIALGQIEMGLLSQPTPSAAEMRRLPYLLRILSAARPLSSIPTFGELKDNNDVTKDDDDDDEILNEAVRRLENRAALYSVAEGVEVTSCHLAPAVCRKISKLKPFRTLTRETEDLLLARRADNMEVDDENDDSLLSNDEEDAEQGSKGPTSTSAGHRRSSIDPRVAIKTQGEDSQEANVVRILAELSSLVVQSLKTPKHDDDELIDWSISMDESTLAEPGSKVDKNIGGAMVSSDLGATVVSLMHHAAVLRHDHVAGALCRAALPQAPSLIARMGANAPAAIPILVRGCIQAYEKASQSRSKNHAIASSARQAIKSLASLSVREASRIRSMLERDGVMVDVQLELAMKLDSISALCLLTESLSLKNETCTHNFVVSQKRDRIGEGFSRVQMRALTSHLKENSTLLTSTIEFLLRDLATLASEESKRKSWVRLSFTLSAFSWIFVRVPVDNLVPTLSATQQQSILESLRKVVKSFSLFVDKDAKLHASNPSDRFFSLLVCCSLSYLMVLCSSDTSNELSRQHAVSVLRDILLTNKPSRQSETLAIAVQDGFLYNNPLDLSTILFRVLSKAKVMDSELPPWFPKYITDKAAKTCQWLSSHSDCSLSDENSRNESYSDSQVLRTLRVLRQTSGISNDDKARICEHLLNAMFTDESLSSSMLLCSAVPCFIRLSVRVLHAKSLLRIPLVLPLQVQNMVSDFVRLQQSLCLNPSGARFLLMLLYCFEFLENVPDSPYAVDLGEMPLREIYGLCLTRSKTVISQRASEKFIFFIEKHAPEVPFWNQVVSLQCQRDRGTVNKIELRSILQLGMKDEASDISASIVEKTFLSATGSLSDAELMTTVVNCLLSTAIKPHVHYSHGVICRDPLLVFKCASNIFKKRGFRRIAIFVISRLLEINDRLTHRTTKDKYTEAEYISARNFIVLQCILHSLSNEAVTNQCMLSTGLLRRLVASHDGLAAMIVKLVRDDVIVEWFADALPEAIDDWKAFLFILTERGTMTLVERLVASHRVLRVVVYQGLRLEKESQKLSQAIFAHLIACFPLTVGPVGVPVSLVGEWNVADATKAAREATFRMIQTIGRVKSFRQGLKIECMTSLQKLAVMCKAETSGTLPSSVAVRQKTAVMEILDAIQETTDLIGTGMQV